MLDTWPLFLLMLSWLCSLYTVKRIIKLKKENVFSFEPLSKNNVKWVLILVFVVLILMTVVTCYFLLLGFNQYGLAAHSLMFFKLSGVLMLVFSATSLVYHCSKDKHYHR